VAASDPASSFIVPNATVRAILPSSGFIHEYVEWASTRTDAPTVYHLGVALSLVSVCCSPGLGVIWPGGELSPNLYTMLVGDSVINRKSTTMKMGLKLLRKVCPDRVGLSPGSHEGLLRSLERQSQQIIPEPEFSRFLSQAHGRNYLNAVKQSYTDAYDGEPLSRITAYRETEIEDHNLSILAACAPGYLERYLEPQDLTAGFFARWMLFCGKRDTFKLNLTPDPDGKQRMIDHLFRLYEYSPGGESYFTDKAQQHFENRARQIDHVALHEMDADDESRGVIARAPTMMAKVSLLLGVCTYVNNLSEDAPPPDPLERPTIQITLEDVINAERIVHLHMTSVLNIQENLAQSPEMLLRRRVLNIVSKQQPCSVGTISKDAKVLVKRVRPVIETLLEQGMIKQVAAGTTTMYQIAGPQKPNPANNKDAEKV